MIDGARITIRNAGFLLAQRGFHILASFLFAVLVPRMMGPGDYGRYALVTSLYLWLVWGSDLSSSQVMGRYVPNFVLQGEKEKLQKFFSNLLAVSLVSGALCACLYLLLTALWLTDLDLILLITMSVTLLFRATAHPFFTLFLGLNQAARWGMGEILRHWFILVLVIIGFYLASLQGAFLGLWLTECVILSIGIWWGKSYFSWTEFRLDVRYLTPYLRFGLIFLLFNLLSSAFQCSGEVMVRLFYPDYVQVGYFGLANNVYFSIALVIPQFTIAFAPLMITLQTQGKTEILRQWIEQLINGLTVGGMFVVFGILLLGDNLVPLVLGAAYQPVAANLFPLSLTLWVQVLSSVAILLTVVHNHPKTAVMSAVIRLIAIWTFGPFLIAKWGSLGGCYAVLFASAICAGYLTWRMKRVITYSLRKWAFIIALGFIFLPLLWLQSSWPINVLLYAVFGVGYCALLLLLRIFTFSEAVAVGRAFRSKNRILNGSKSVGKEYVDG
jgi:O-antigen/teichoic acid export membrane protein